LFTDNGERKLQSGRTFPSIAESRRTSYPFSCPFYYFHTVESSDSCPLR